LYFVIICEDIFSYGPFVVVFKKSLDVFFALIATADENELIVHHVLMALIGGLNEIFNNELNRQNILARYDEFLICVDAVIDNGFVVISDWCMLFNLCKDNY
jgi:hypothetical protein